jgi:cell division protein FtsL
MKLKHLIGAVIFGLFLINIILFGKSVILADNIQKIDTQIQKTIEENRELEKKAYSISSLETLDKMAANLGFTKKAEPLYLKTLQFANIPQ